MSANGTQNVLSRQDIRQLSVDGFTGPFDLLLALVRKHQLDIMEIRLSVITNDYLHCLDVMANELSLEVSGEFLEMAATLVYLKSRRLLPRPEASEENPDESLLPLTEEDLLRRLAEFERFQRAAEALWARPVLGRDTFARPELTTVPTGKGPVTVKVIELAEAYRAIVAKRRPATLRESRDASLSMADAVRRVLGTVAPGRPVPFVGLLRPGESRADVVVLFAALLELSRLGFVRLMQRPLQDDDLYLAVGEHHGDELAIRRLLTQLEEL